MKKREPASNRSPLLIVHAVGESAKLYARPYSCSQGMLQIFDQVVSIFNAYRQADQAIRQANAEALLPGNTGVGHSGWVSDQRFHASQ